METLNNIFHNMKLTDIESAIANQINELEIGYYDAKLAVMLYILIKNGIEKFDMIITDAFPDALKKDFQKMQEEYSKKILSYKSHLNENKKIINAIEKVNTDFSNIEEKIKVLLSEFDNLTRLKVEEREGNSIAELYHQK